MKKEKKIISDLMEACKTLMDEVCGQAATDWGIVNDAMVEGAAYLTEKKE